MRLAVHGLQFTDSDVGFAAEVNRLQHLEQSLPGAGTAFLSHRSKPGNPFSPSKAQITAYLRRENGPQGRSLAPIVSPP